MGKVLLWRLSVSHSTFQQDPHCYLVLSAWEIKGQMNFSSGSLVFNTQSMNFTELSEILRTFCTCVHVHTCVILGIRFSHWLLMVTGYLRSAVRGKLVWLKMAALSGKRKKMLVFSFLVHTKVCLQAREQLSFSSIQTTAKPIASGMGPSISQKDSTAWFPLFYIFLSQILCP